MFDVWTYFTNFWKSLIIISLTTKNVFLPLYHIVKGFKLFFTLLILTVNGKIFAGVVSGFIFVAGSGNYIGRKKNARVKF